MSINIGPWFNVLYNLICILYIVHCTNNVNLSLKGNQKLFCESFHKFFLAPIFSRNLNVCYLSFYFMKFYKFFTIKTRIWSKISYKLTVKTTQKCNRGIF